MKRLPTLGEPFLYVGTKASTNVHIGRIFRRSHRILCEKA